MASLLERTGETQRILEQVLTKDMSRAEIISKVLKISSQRGLPFKCYLMLEKWAVRTYQDDEGI